jgi:tetratricopeptide (TPR) repeat protein
LTDSERSQLVLPLRGRQLEVWNILIRAAKDNHEADLLKTGLSRAHLDEICSVLLQKSYAVLAPGGMLDLCSFLIHKQLTPFAFDQMRVLEKRLAKTGGHKELEESYILALYITHLAPPEEQEYEYVRHVETLLLRHRSRGSAFDKDVIKIFDYRFKLLSDFQIGEQSEKVHARLAAEFESMGPRSLGSKNPFVRYQYHRTGVIFCLLYKKDAESFLRHWEAANKLLSSVPVPIFEREQLMVRSYRTEYDFMIGNFEAAYEALKTLSEEKTNYNRIVAIGHFRLREFDLATILGHYEEAEEIFLETPTANFDHVANSRIAVVYLRAAVLYLLWDKYPKAHECIRKGVAITAGRSYSFFNDVRLRFIEATYYYLKNDREYALNVCQRALHFLRSRELGLGESEFGFYFKLIEAAIAFHGNGKPIPVKIMNHYKKYRNGQFRFFGKLLDKIIQTRPR